jgi:hypothetical protein
LICRALLSAVLIVLGYLEFVDVTTITNNPGTKRFVQLLTGGVEAAAWFGYLIAAMELFGARVRRGMIQLAWRFLMFQKNSALAQWFRTRTENARGTRKLMIVTLARKLLIALWRLLLLLQSPARLSA